VASLPSPKAMNAQISVDVAGVFRVSAVLTSATNPALHAPLNKAVAVFTIIMPRHFRQMNLSMLIQFVSGNLF
jgi:hypothetical protein